MKIAELFVALGFDIKGDKDLHAVERGMMKAEGAALTLLAGVGALNFAFYRMMTTATEAGTALDKFRVTTGLSSEELQRWQLAGQRAGIQGEEMIKTITALQTAQKNVMLGQGDFSPFQFFGLSVSQNPFEQLKTLHEKIQTMDPAFARIMASRLGISENLFQWLRRDNLELDRFNQELMLTNQQQRTFWNLNKAWQEFLFTLIALKNKFAEGFAEPLTVVLNFLTRLLLVGARFVDWLNGTSVAANVMKTGLLAAAGAMVVLLGILSALSVVLGALAVGLKVAALGVLPLLIELAPLLLVIGLLAAAIVALILLLNDWWTAINGGKSLLDWSASIKTVNAMATAIQWVIDRLEALKKLNDNGPWKSISNFLGSNGVNGISLLPGMTPAMAGGTTIHQENNTRIMVDGAGDPRAVGRETAGALQRTINNAAGSLRPKEY